MIYRKTDVYFRYKIPNVVTVQIDTREQVPLLFPSTIQVGHPELFYRALPIAVETEKIKLDFGDYRLKEYPELAVVERKASQMEIWKNMNDSRDRIRQAESFRKLKSGCRHPYLMMEASAGELFKIGGKIKNPELVVHRLSLALAKYGLHLLFIPWRSRNADTRRKIGTLLIHLMLGCALRETFETPPLLLE
jgi:hypothetical protein